MINVSVSDRKGASFLFSASPGERLLHAGLAAGIPLPHECATGTCGSCKATVVTGEIQRLWPAAPGAKSCRNANEILLCQSAARADIELSLRNSFITECNPSCGYTSGELALARKLTADVYLFTLKLKDPMTYHPGQFVLLSGFGVDGPRAYSMIRHDSGRVELNLLIRKGGGAFTNALFDGAANTPVNVFGPLGRATFSCSEDRPFVAIAGGSGIAGILSILHHALSGEHFQKHRSHVFFGLRSSADAYLMDELSLAVAQSDERLKVMVAFSDAPCPTDFSARYPLLDFTQGFVSDAVVKKLFQEENALQDAKPIFFVAGPPPMVSATMRALMVDGKISPTEIRYDRFG